MTILIPALNYADCLAVTLPAWKAMSPGATIRVITSPEDEATQDVAAGLGVDVVVTSVWTADGARLNKARALDEAMGSPAVGEVFASVDADVYPCGAFPSDQAIAPGTIYGCARYLCRSSSELRDHLEGRTSRKRLELLGPKVRGNDYNSLANLPRFVEETAKECLGFFQAFRWAGQRFGSYPTAGRCDTNFRQQFEHVVGLTAFYVLHLGTPNRLNWSGRVAPQWAIA